MTVPVGGSVVGGGGGAALTVEEADGTPTVASVTKIKLPNTTLTDDGSGVVTFVPTAHGVTAEELDGTPTGPVSTIKFPNTTLAIVGTTATYTPASSGLTAEELDGSPTGTVDTIKFPNTTLAIVGSVATYTPAAGGSALTVQDADGTPIDTAVTTIKFPNGAVTVDSAGVVSIDSYPAPLGVNGATLASFAPYLRAGYTFNDASGSITDSVGVPHDLAAGGTSTYLETGKNGTAIKFNASSYFYRPPHGFSPGVSEFTLNWWVKTSDVTVESYLLQLSPSLTTTSRTGPFIYQSKLHLILTGGANPVGSTTLVNDTWYMITWQRINDGGTYYHRVFINGVQEHNTSTDGTFDYEQDYLWLGVYPYSTPIYSPTLTVDELLYYTGPDGYGAISPAAILELYNSGTGIFLDTTGTPSGLGFSHADLVGFNQYLHDYWKCEESGTPLIDAISNNSLAGNGTPTYSVTGKNNNCIELAGAGSHYFSRPGSFLHKADQEFTFSCWLYADSLTPNLAVWVGYTTGTNEMSTQVYSTGVINHYWYTGGVYRQGPITATGVFTTGAWHHLVITKAISGSVYTSQIYLNGVSVASESSLGAALYSDASSYTTMYMGRDPAAVARDWDGKIDEVSYWKGIALDSAAVTALYNAGSGRFLESV